MTSDTLLSDIIATIAGGVLLAVLFFLGKEKWFPLPDVAGRWYFEARTVTTAYRPYDGMILRFVAMLWREGHTVQGTFEKVYEKSSTGERTFTGTNRTRGVVDGYIEKNYLGRDRLLLHMVEDGHGRESTSFHHLILDSGERMSGEFTSMVADQTGTATWQREPF
jgi:hypothetical protein